MTKEIIDYLFYLSELSLNNNEFPVSAIIFDESGIISTGYNTRNSSNLTIDHAEIKAIIDANKKLKSWRLTNKCMVVTLEPCDMCKTVIKEARLKHCYYLIPRLKYKKQNKCTIFENSIDMDVIDQNKLHNYEKNISSFFKSKR